ncbi:hypothetical protein CYLTODRAFT_109767 [Cylindrobasidium torrendii FP15055 ss-10]|uniref:Uncharacterized protein n=1 Tax=Cylindrobasidium torrendii FP15055 ss-10 TaxID=1314674 RepID=A0A0D7BM94_9AGAR|nr:hypothetical protein CYLTODRAFT_109767 [Cylindrobasidium torrendii FP15055 ss-10]
MPFPTNTVEILDDVWNPKASIIHVEAVDPDDAYWNSYGDEEGEDHGLHDAHTAKHPDTTHNSEDAYWAQYSSVHGTADSTIPSPMPERRRAPHVHETSHLHEDYLGVAHAQNSFMRRNQHAIDLSDRLHALNERVESFPLPGDEDEEDMPGLVHPYSSDEESTAASAQARDEEEESMPELVNRDSTDTQSSAAQARDEVIVPTTAGPMSREVDIALKEAIRGVYGLWKMGAGNGSADNGEFVELVKEAVHGL